MLDDRQRSKVIRVDGDRSLLFERRVGDFTVQRRVIETHRCIIHQDILRVGLIVGAGAGVIVGAVGGLIVAAAADVGAAAASAADRVGAGTEV